MILCAVIFGLLLYRAGLNFKVATAIGIAMVVGCIFAGYYLPIRLSYHTWMVALLVYIVVAASIPVNVLLQPRDYLNAWLLVFGLALGSASLIVGRFDMDFPLFTAFSVPVIKGGTKVISGPFWPVIPLIIACGSLSGFHALVGSGTTSKQLDREVDALFVGCGAMFTEGFLSTIVIACLGALALSVAGEAGELAAAYRNGALERSPVEFSNAYIAAMNELGGPIGIFSKSFGLAASRALHLSEQFVTVIAGLWCSAFAMTTLDTTNRIARYTWAELLDPLKGVSKRLHAALTYRWIAAVVPAGLGILLAWTGKYSILWPAFGGANQMLASIALLTAAVWVIKHLKSKGGLTVLVPALLLWVTVSAALLWYLVEAVPDFARKSAVQGWALGGLTVIMLLLNLLLLADFIGRLRK
jgi:carbon starvation protein